MAGKVHTSSPGTPSPSQVHAERSQEYFRSSVSDRNEQSGKMAALVNVCSGCKWEIQRLPIMRHRACSLPTLREARAKPLGPDHTLALGNSVPVRTRGAQLVLDAGHIHLAK